MSPAVDCFRPAGWQAGHFTALARLLIVLLVLIVPGVLQAAQNSVEAMKLEALRYYHGTGVRQDYAAALALYEAAARLGDIEASYIAGGMYYTGKGTGKNPAKAFQYLHYAASKGKSSADAKRALAQFYLLGEVVPKDYGKAVQWYEEAAASGDTKSQVELGFLYFVGRGVEQDYAKAYDLFKQAAMQNEPMAQYNVGIMWYTGNGVPESSLEQAYAWFSLAAASNFADAVAAQNFLQSVLTAEELARSQRLATALFEQLNQKPSSAAR